MHILVSLVPVLILVLGGLILFLVGPVFEKSIILLFG